MSSMEQLRTRPIFFTAAVLGAFCVSTAAQTVKENPAPAAVQGKVVPGSARPIEGTNAFEGKGRSRKAADSSEPLPPKVKNVQPAAMDQSGKVEPVKDSGNVTRPVPPEPKVLTRQSTAPAPTVRTPSPAPTTNPDPQDAHPAPQAGFEIPAVHPPDPVEIAAMAHSFLFAEPGKNVVPPTQVAEVAVGIHPISLWNPEKQAVHPIPLSESGKVKVLPVDQTNPGPSQP
jgi:hypothetical protein